MRVKRITAAVVAGLAALAVSPSAANAVDRGDGRAGCNSGEICFQWIWDNFSTSQYQRHFWYSDSDHNNDTFGLMPDHPKPPVTVAGNVEGIWNRDTQCSVTMYVSTSYRNGYATIARNVRQSISPWNQSHKRCP